ncbi:MAG: NAD(P)/FAD-dependent oxidoreductase [Candidatus Thorarchaeota archaeon]
MLEEQTHYDSLIVGGGPAGIATAMHLGFHGYKALVVDRRSSPMFFATTQIHNYPGVKPLLTSREILRKMKTELRDYNVSEIFGNVLSIQGTFPQFEAQIQSAKGINAMALAKTVVFATGISRKHPRVKGSWKKWLPYAAKDGRSFYCPDCDAPLTAGKDVLIVNAGTANSALHTARCISPYASRIRIFMTEDGYVPFTEESKTILNKERFEWTSGKIQDIKIRESGEDQLLITSDNRQLNCDVFFVSWIGVPRSELAVKLGVGVDTQGNIITDHRGQTNIEGLYAAGDVRPITQAVATAVGTGVYVGIMIANKLLESRTNRSLNSLD